MGWAMALDVIAEDTFAAGIIRSVEGQRISENGVYDLINALIDDDGGISRRGGSAYQTTSDYSGGSFTGIAALPTAAGERVVVWNSTKLAVLDGAGTSATTVHTTDSFANPPRPLSRASGAGDLVLFAEDPPGSVTQRTFVMGYGGSRKSADMLAITVSYTNGSRTVTYATGGLSANVDAGMIVATPTPNSNYGVVESVDSDTQVTLTAPWPGPTGAIAGSGFYRLTLGHSDNIGVGGFVTAVGSPARAIIAGGHRIAFSPAGDPFTFNATDYHVVPAHALILGAQGIGDTALIFTSAGLWAITNMSYDLTDDFGNPQQAVTQINPDLILWGDPGIASYRGGFVVPAIDDVYLVDGTGAAQPVSSAIRPLYRSYVDAGYKPGLASVFRGYYFLPILNGTTWVDSLVCRLDGTQPAWGRWNGYGTQTVAFARHVRASAQQPKLYSVTGARVVNLTGTFSPSSSNKNDADATTHVTTVVTRDFAVTRQLETLWKYLRARFQLTDAASDNPTLTVEYAVGPPELESWTSFGPWTEGTGETSSKLLIGDSGKRAQSIRFRFKTSGPAAKFVLRSLEVFYRMSRKL